MRSIPRLLVVFGLFVGTVIFAQEETDNIDSLFETPAEDVTATASPEDAAIDHTAAFNVQDKLGVSGNFTATGGVGLGYADYSGIQQPWDNLDGSFLAFSKLLFILDARPDPDIRVHGGFSVSLQPSTGNYSWSTIAVDELFCDYTLLDKMFIRFGKHTITWGQGRLYTPGDLMDGSENGTALRLSFPTVLSGLSFVTLAQKSFFADPAQPSVTEFAHGALVDAVVGNLRTSFGFRYQKAEGYRALASFKVNVLRTELLCDAVGRYDAEEAKGATTLLGFYRTWNDLTAYGEWQYDYAESATTHAVGVAITYNNLGGSSVDIGIKWLHALDPVSGAVAVGVSWDPFKFVKTTVALPVVYGEPGRYDILDEDMPLTQRISLVLSAKITATF